MPRFPYILRSLDFTISVSPYNTFIFLNFNTFKPLNNIFLFDLNPMSLKPNVLESLSLKIFRKLNFYSTVYLGSLYLK